MIASLYSIGLLCIVIFLSGGIGILALKRFGFIELHSLPGLILAIPIGMGVIAYFNILAWITQEI